MTKCFWKPKQVKTVFGEKYYREWMKNHFPLLFGKDFINHNVYTFAADYSKYKPYMDTGASGLIEYGNEYLSVSKDKSINEVIMFFIKNLLVIKVGNSLPRKKRTC